MYLLWIPHMYCVLYMLREVHSSSNADTTAKAFYSYLQMCLWSWLLHKTTSNSFLGDPVLSLHVREYLKTARSSSGDTSLMLPPSCSLIRFRQVVGAKRALLRLRKFEEAGVFRCHQSWITPKNKSQEWDFRARHLSLTCSLCLSASMPRSSPQAGKMTVRFILKSSMPILFPGPVPWFLSRLNFPSHSNITSQTCFESILSYQLLVELGDVIGWRVSLHR